MQSDRLLKALPKKISAYFALKMEWKYSETYTYMRNRSVDFVLWIK